MDNKTMCLLFALLVLLHSALCTEIETSGYICESGWHLVTPVPTLCVRLSDDKLGFSDARRRCRLMDSTLIRLSDQRVTKFIYEITGYMGYYWIGLEKSYGRSKNYRWINSDDEVTREEKANFVDRFVYWKAYDRRERSCVYLIAHEQGWFGTNDSQEKRNFICRKRSKCAVSHFGQNCESECHCLNEPCDGTTVCKYGCEKGWIGRECTKKIEPTEVSYYCFNTTSKGASVLLRVDTKGLQYRVMNGLDADQKPVEGCDMSTFTHNPDTNVYSKEMVVDPSQSDSTHCAANKTDETTWVWEFALREIVGVQSLNDFIFKVTCDFSKADGLATIHGENLEVSGNITSDVKDIKVKEEEVTLTLVNPITQAELHKAELGSIVQLQFQLHEHSGFSAKGVSPFNCQAFSTDGKFTKQLSDEKGCSSDRQPFLTGNSTVFKRMFALFAFPGTAVINFRCEYEYCFKAEMKCDNRCRYSITNGRRKRSSSKTTKPVYTSVEVLPRKEEELEVNPPRETGDTLRGVPLLYLNPITCSMFLFLLSVFLLYYVFFIKSLKKAVEEMKQELKMQNRWQRL